MLLILILYYDWLISLLLLILILYYDWLIPLLLLILILYYDWLIHLLLLILILYCDWLIFLFLILCYDWLVYQDHSLAELPLLVHKYSLVSLLSRSLLFLLQAFRLVFSDLVSSLALYLVPVLCFLSLPELIDIFLSLVSPLFPLFLLFSAIRSFLSPLNPNLTLRKAFLLYFFILSPCLPYCPLWLPRLLHLPNPLPGWIR